MALLFTSLVALLFTSLVALLFTSLVALLFTSLVALLFTSGCHLVESHWHEESLLWCLCVCCNELCLLHI